MLLLYLLLVTGLRTAYAAESLIDPTSKDSSLPAARQFGAIGLGAGLVVAGSVVAALLGLHLLGVGARLFLFPAFSAFGKKRNSRLRRNSPFGHLPLDDESDLDLDARSWLADQSNKALTDLSIVLQDYLRNFQRVVKNGAFGSAPSSSSNKSSFAMKVLGSSNQKKAEESSSSGDEIILSRFTLIHCR